MKVTADRQSPAVDAFLSRSEPGLILSKYISPSQINLIFTMYTNTNSLKLKILVIVVMCNGWDNTKKL